MRVAAASLEDLPALAEVHVASWRSAYAGILPADYLANLSVERRHASWRTVLSEGKSQLLVAMEGTAVVGFVSFGRCRDAAAAQDCGELWALYVSPVAWSTGVGQALWKEARVRLNASGFRSASLWVIKENQRAIRFYCAAGFAIEADSEKEFELGGARIREVRMVADNGSEHL
ncbi:MAG: GNAT family N-acetyltransferase [Ramlibacter sp.]|nr:GNAT family N-acetyltransferase [Ramlibacter sp.]